MGERLSLLRGRRTQKQAAYEWGISLNSLRRYESGTGVPDAARVALICRQEGVSPDWLLMGTGDAPTAAIIVDMARRAVDSVAERHVAESAGSYRVEVSTIPDAALLGAALEALAARVSFRELSPEGKGRALRALYDLCVAAGEAPADLLSPAPGPRGEDTDPDL
jgi:transcriptional regulator with XRE-family HTH domain